MPPNDGPDPYRVHADSELRGRPRAAPKGIAPSFDVLENRGAQVVTLLRREYLDANEIERLGTDLKSYFAEKPLAKVVLDMQRVHNLSSAALGTLLNLRTAIESTGGVFILVGIHGDLMKVFKMTHLHNVLKIKEHVADAIASL